MVQYQAMHFPWDIEIRTNSGKAFFKSTVYSRTLLHQKCPWYRPIYIAVELYTAQQQQQKWALCLCRRTLSDPVRRHHRRDVSRSDCQTLGHGYPGWLRAYVYMSHLHKPSSKTTTPSPPESTYLHSSR